MIDSLIQNNITEPAGFFSIKLLIFDRFFYTISFPIMSSLVRLSVFSRYWFTIFWYLENLHVIVMICYFGSFMIIPNHFCLTKYIFSRYLNHDFLL